MMRGSKQQAPARNIAEDKKAVKEILAQHMAGYAKTEFKGTTGRTFKLPAKFEPVAADKGKRRAQVGAAAQQWFYTYTTPSTTDCSTTAKAPIVSGVITNQCLVDVKNNDSSVFVSCDFTNRKFSLSLLFFFFFFF
jgi:hypothetical protein